METFYVDGERGFNSDYAKAFFTRLGIKLETRAPNQHARFIERRGAILRITMHLIEEQCAREGIEINFDSLLSEGIFAGNAFTYVGGVSPYNALYGRQPLCLPDLHIPGQPGGPGEELGGRRNHRIREISLQCMVQATSISRINRATHTRTSRTGVGQYNEGDLVDYWRPPPTKDISGWHGPVRVVRNKPEAGQVICKIKGEDLPCRLQDVRLSLFVFFASLDGFYDNAGDAAAVVIDAIELVPKDTPAQTFGYIDGDKVTNHSKKYPRVHAALDYIVRVCFQLTNVSQVRLARGVRRLRASGGGHRSILFWWLGRNSEDLQVFESDSTDIDVAFVVGERFRESRLMQVIFGTDGSGNITDIVDDMATRSLDSTGSPGDTPNDDNDHASNNDRLSTIDEGSNEDASSTLLGSKRDFYERCPEDLRPSLDEAWAALLLEDDLEVVYVGSESILAEGADANSRSYNFTLASEVNPDTSWAVYFTANPNEQYAHYLSAQLGRDLYATHNACDDDGQPCVELYFSREMSKCLLDDSDFGPSDHAVLQVLFAGTKRAVIQRDSDLLTNDELQNNQKLVQAAILEELRIWVKHNCFEIRDRKTARNVMTSRFVAKWKILTGADGKPQRIIRMRMAIRGFLDWDASNLETYAGTARRQSQRLLASETACREGWELVTLDIEKAFLQGMTYKEMHELTGEPERIVNFSLPKGAAEMLRMLPGFEHFDESIHVCGCTKPGTGTKDAPRAFSMKLASVTRNDPLNMKPTTYDPEMEMQHDENGELQLLSTKHVDDVKLGGPTKNIDYYMSIVEKTFGKLTVKRRQFTNCGVRHTQEQNGTITLDQDEYLKALKPIVHSDLTGADPESPATPDLVALFWSLLGALAYSLITQHWLAVYVVALQRATKEPRMIHIRRLNALVRKAQQAPARIVYECMTCNKDLDVHSDSGFSKEQEKGYGIRGANYIRNGRHRQTSEPVAHLLDSECKSHTHVTRSTFAAETLAATVAADHVIPLATTLHEFNNGPVTAYQARRVREEGGLSFDVTLTVDAMSLYAAVAASTIKVPAERSLAGHLYWLRELIDNHVLRRLRWCDTRDMSADCHTKGSIDRQVILDLMKGHYRFRHERRGFPDDA